MTVSVVVLARAVFAAARLLPLVGCAPCFLSCRLRLAGAKKSGAQASAPKTQESAKYFPTIPTFHLFPHIFFVGP